MARRASGTLAFVTSGLRAANNQSNGLELLAEAQGNIYKYKQHKSIMSYCCCLESELSGPIHLTWLYQLIITAARSMASYGEPLYRRLHEVCKQI